MVIVPRLRGIGGRTHDVSLVLGTDDLHREADYVALSRGIKSNMLYVVGGVERDVDITHGPARTPRDPMDLVTDALQQSQKKDLALESLLPVQELLDRLHRIEVEAVRSRSASKPSRRLRP